MGCDGGGDGGMAGDYETQTQENKLHLRETELVLS